MMVRTSIALLIAAAVSAFAAPAQAQLSAGPLVRTLPTIDGFGEIEIVVTNTGAERVDVTIEVNDWAVDSAGDHTFRPVGTVAGSCAGRLTSATRMLELAAGAARPVTLAFRGAADEACRNIVFFRITHAPDVLAGDRLIISTGVKVYVEPVSGPSRRDP